MRLYICPWDFWWEAPRPRAVTDLPLIMAQTFHHIPLGQHCYMIEPADVLQMRRLLRQRGYFNHIQVVNPQATRRALQRMCKRQVGTAALRRRIRVHYECRGGGCYIIECYGSNGSQIPLPDI